jgi:hypothetical protein
VISGSRRSLDCPSVARGDRGGIMMFDALDVDEISWLRSELEVASAGSYQGAKFKSISIRV